MDKRIAVLGTGAIGSPIGGLLTRAGHDVALIDQWAAHVEAMKAHGLRITIGPRNSPEAEYVVPVRAYHLCEVCTLHQQFDIVFLACKSYDTRWMVQFIEPYLKPDGVLVSVQNSLNDEWIVPIIGDDRDIGCVLTGGGELLKPGHVWRNRSMEHHYYTLGELHGKVTPRLEEVVRILSDAGKTRISTNIRGAKWSKLVVNSMTAPLTVLTDKRSWELIDAPNYLASCVRLGKEAVQVGVALGYNMEAVWGLTAEAMLNSPEEAAVNRIRTASRGASEGAINMSQYDIRNGRPTEIGGYLNGLVIRKGVEASIPTPVNESATALALRVVRGELRQDVSNLNLIELS
ncbi:ketopantoate reductase family protein [Chloroflexota bacterium]